MVSVNAASGHFHHIIFRKHRQDVNVLQELKPDSLNSWNHGWIISTFPAWSLSRTEWVAVVSSAILRLKVGHQYVKRLTDTWQMSLSGCSLLCNAHLKNPVEASCPWVESHCGQPVPQVPCHPVLSWTMPLGWSFCCGRGVSPLCVWGFSFFFCVYAATHLPRRQGLELSPSLLLCISLELINSLGLYDWGDCLGALNPIQLIKS